MSGFFGKIPSHGDFITRDLPRGFLDAWDTWLQTSIAESKALLGERWLDAYLTAPIWRFAIVPGLCGAEGWTGVLMASVDRVGRYFPLTIATPLPDGVTPLDVPGGAGPWFDAIERIALRTLDDDRFEANALRDAIGGIGPIRIDRGQPEVATAAGAAWSLVLLGLPGVRLAPALAHVLVARQAPRYSLWWTAGTEDALPAAVVVADLPDPQCFVDLLHGAAGEPLPAGGARGATA